MDCRVDSPPFERQLTDLVPVIRAYAMVVCRVRSDADDLTQDTLERAWKGRGGFEPGTNLKAWVFTILRNGHAGDWRRNRRMVEDPDGREAARLSSEAPQPWRVQYTDVLNAIARLDPESRHALMMVVAGLSYEETAQACGCPLRTVQSRVRRARMRLADHTDFAVAAA